MDQQLSLVSIADGIVDILNFSLFLIEKGLIENESPSVWFPKGFLFVYFFFFIPNGHHTPRSNDTVIAGISNGKTIKP